MVLFGHLTLLRGLQVRFFSSLVPTRITGALSPTLITSDWSTALLLPCIKAVYLIRIARHVRRFSGIAFDHGRRRPLVNI